MKEDQSIAVLSLFDGISCTRLALEKAGIKINKYYSSEICQSAISVQNHHFSADCRFIQLGDVRNIDGEKLKDEVDIILCGFPCTNLSSINKERAGLEGNESKLFYEALRILKEIGPFKPTGEKRYVLFENVGSMSKANRDKITNELRVVFPDIKVLHINSALVSASNRRRIYWTNIPDATIPEPIDIKYSDIIENGYVDRSKSNPVLSTNVTLTKGIYRHYEHTIGNIIFKDENFANYSIPEKLAIYPIILDNSKYKGKPGAIKDEYDFPNGCYRLPSIRELSRLMTIPDHYLCDVNTISRTEKERLIGLSFTVDMVAHLLKSLKIIYE